MRSGINLIIGIILIVGLMNVVLATETTPSEKDLGGFSFSSWLKHTLKIDKFSVVGDSRQCSDYPDWTFATSGGDTFHGKASDYCSSGYGLWDVFIGDSWIGWKEFKDRADITCNSANTQCNFQLYCCSHNECSSDSDCSDWGIGIACKSASCVSWKAGYQCTAEGITENDIPYEYSSFNYCSSVYVKCYYYPGYGDSCLERIYNGQITCPDDYRSQDVYYGKSVCEANIPQDVPPGNEGGNGGTQTSGEIQISNIILPDESQPIEKRGVTDKQTFKVTLKNTGTTDKTINVEAGFYTQEYADNIANLFSIVSPIQSCNEDEDFVNAKSVLLSPGDPVTVEIQVSPLPTYVTLPKGEYDLRDIKLVSFLGVYKTCCEDADGDGECDIGTGGYEDFGYNREWISTYALPPQDILCGDETYGKIGTWLEPNKIKIEDDYRKCIKPLVYTNQSEIGWDSSARQKGLTKSEIGDATTPTLLQSMCTLPEQCESESKCSSLQSLVEDEVISDIQARQIADSISNGITGTISVGGGITATVACATILGGLTAGIAVPICGAVGIVSGLGLDNFFDSLVEADLSKTGLCVKEGGSWCDFAEKLAFYDFANNKCTSGSIIMGALAFLLLLIVLRK